MPLEEVSSEYDGNFAKDVFAELDPRGREDVLQHVKGVTEVFFPNCKESVPVDEVANYLVHLERNIGHHGVPPLLESIGLSVDQTCISLTGTREELSRALENLEKSTI